MWFASKGHKLANDGEIILQTSLKRGNPNIIHRAGNLARHAQGKPLQPVKGLSKCTDCTVTTGSDGRYVCCIQYNFNYVNNIHILLSCYSVCLYSIVQGLVCHTGTRIVCTVHVQIDLFALTVCTCNAVKLTMLACTTATHCITHTCALQCTTYSVTIREGTKVLGVISAEQLSLYERILITLHLAKADEPELHRLVTDGTKVRVERVQDNIITTLWE
jgi:hypothetical protein